MRVYSRKGVVLLLNVAMSIYEQVGRLKPIKPNNPCS